MIQLFIHASQFSYEVKEKAIENAEEDYLPALQKNNALVVFTTVEKEDDNETVKKAIENINDIFSKVKASCVVIYPYAHLSSNLAEPKKAIEILKEVEKKLNNVEVYRAPFGWYKAFSISCYGHPLSELSRRITKTVEYSKSEEMAICEKFGFPYSAKASFMKTAVIEYIKEIIKPESVIIGNTDKIEQNNKNIMIIKYIKQEGRQLPCVNEDPKIKIIITKNPEDFFPEEFSDSKNTYKIWEKVNNGISIDLGNLLYYILLNAKKNDTPSLPLWLAPIHVRLLPVKKEFEEQAINFANQLISQQIRAEVDNKEDSLGNKIRRAGMDWIPFIAIVGEREVKTNALTVRIRGKNEQKSLTIEEIAGIIKNEDKLLLKQNLPVKMFD
ncbi:threonyl-tRNA synthetase editing domain-containing protein [Acidianus manzaensis]|uniref:Ser-tRNA(Thr) hydrolase n=1 Tax=Acidianus manzaensis TaxID=282676 RepID=A0A1W6K276_9CREN|nr:threonyl-tRNA synthetase editing domain-containing protein [Acidianus manzaensis]ARM76626.1 Ser-tRNA(Thr) hydrolase [Acidianus manzaensis]